MGSGEQGESQVRDQFAFGFFLKMWESASKGKGREGPPKSLPCDSCFAPGVSYTNNPGGTWEAQEADSLSFPHLQVPVLRRLGHSKQGPFYPGTQA